MTRRPPRADPEALEKYREFHRFDPKKVGPMPSLVIPGQLRNAGKAKWITYRSGKVDPGTMEKPKRTFDYVHEFSAGVRVYLPDGRDTDVPKELAGSDALVKLGDCLGFQFEDVEAVSRAPLPELYCTPSGKYLLVVQSKRDVLAAIYGGGLGVFARGIDG